MRGPQRRQGADRLFPPALARDRARRGGLRPVPRGTFRPSRCLWGWSALVSLALAGGALWYTNRSLPTVDSAAADITRLGEKKSLDAPEREALQGKIAAFNSERFSAPVLHSGLANFIRWLALAAGAVLVLFAWDEVPDSHAAEYHACLLLIVAGTGLTAAANDLVTLFLALELISIPTYVLLYLPRADAPRREAALKYFLLSVFSSALLLFGFSYLYGLSGTTNLAGLADALGTTPEHAGARRRPVDGPGDGDRRSRLPHHGGAVPLLRAGRVPGNGDAQRGPTGGRSQDCGLRGPGAHPRPGAAAGRLHEPGQRPAAGHARPRFPDSGGAMDHGSGDDVARQRAGPVAR